MTNMSTVEFYKLKENEARAYVVQLAELRLKVFNDYPYLYEGNLEYEKHYLETYFNAKNSFILLLKDNDKFIGATTAIWAEEESIEFKSPYVNYGLDPKEICYFGESILLPEYRGKGYGKLFFKEREEFAKSLPGVKYASFCAVVRPDDHPLRPKDYVPLDEFWKSQGYKKVEGLTTEYAWKDKDQSAETAKIMQYWLIDLKESKSSRR